MELSSARRLLQQLWDGSASWRAAQAPRMRLFLAFEAIRRCDLETGADLNPVGGSGQLSAGGVFRCVMFEATEPGQRQEGSLSGRPLREPWSFSLSTRLGAGVIGERTLLRRLCLALADWLNVPPKPLLDVVLAPASNGSSGETQALAVAPNAEHHLEGIVRSSEDDELWLSPVRGRALLLKLQSLDVPILTVLTRETDLWQLLMGGSDNVEPLLCAAHRHTFTLVRLETPAGALVDGLEQTWEAGSGSLSPVELLASAHEHEEPNPQVANHQAQERQMDALVERLSSAVAVAREQGRGSPWPGDLPWVFRPSAAAPLVAGLAWMLRGDTVRSMPALSRSIGKKLFPSVLTVWDDPHLERGGRRRRYDELGEPWRPQCLIEQGRLRAFLHSRDTYQEFLAAGQLSSEGIAGMDSEPPSYSPCSVWTPEGEGMGGVQYGAAASNFFIQPQPSSAGNETLPPDCLELTCRLENFSFMHQAGIISLRLAGWWVKDGQRRAPLQARAVELPLLQTFRKLRAVGADLTFFPAMDGCGTPSLTFEPLLL